VTRFPPLALLVMAALPGPALALDLAMPFPVAGVVAQAQPVASLMVPTGPFAAGALPVRRIEGAVDLRAYRLEAAGRSLTELASPLRAALEAQGYRIALDCETRACGGFDFRFAIEVMPEPGMHVDLGEFRYIVAETADEAVTLLVSRSPSFGFVQVGRVGPAPWEQDAAPVEAPVAPVAPEPPVVTDHGEGPTDPALPEAPVAPVAPLDPGDLIAVLEAEGHVALEDLVFASGSAALEERDFASLGGAGRLAEGRSGAQHRAGRAYRCLGRAKGQCGPVAQAGAGGAAGAADASGRGAGPGDGRGRRPAGAAGQQPDRSGAAEKQAGRGGSDLDPVAASRAGGHTGRQAAPWTRVRGEGVTR
jgi:hypothetical protein